MKSGEQRKDKKREKEKLLYVVLFTSDFSNKTSGFTVSDSMGWYKKSGAC